MMELRATVSYDASALRTLNLVTLFGGKSPVPRIVISAIGLVTGVWLAIFPLLDNSLVRWLAVLMAALAGLLLLSVLWSVCLSPCIVCAQRRRAGMGEIQLIFTYDGIRSESSYRAGTERLELEWQGLDRIAESERYFFLFVTKNTALIVEKRRLSGGSEHDLRAMALSHRGLRLLRCSF